MSIKLDAFSPAVTMLQAMQEGLISAAELMELHLARIERYNPVLNAIAIPNYENARSMAAAADAMRVRRETAPLLGLPITVKESIDVKGLRGSAGAPEFAERRPEQDSRLAARLRKAGSVLMGKTNMALMAASFQTNNPLFGRSNNPWDLGRTPGGSTGGGAAAVAAGLTPLEFGSDIGGSIRIPAAFCGIYGHRPSDTALCRSGHFPGSPLPNQATALGVQGPLARTAKDLELAFDVAAGPDVGEDVAWRLEIPPARHERLGDFRVAVLPPVDWLPVDDDIMAAQEALVDGLGKMGVKVKEASPEALCDMRRHHELFSSLEEAILTRVYTAEQRRERIRALTEILDVNEFLKMRAHALEASAAEYIGWFGLREQYRESYRRFFRDWDVLLTPMTFIPAFQHTDIMDDAVILDVNDMTAPLLRLSVYAGVATLSGHPGTAFPFGLTRSGLPIGLQAVGPYLEDRTPIRFTELVGIEFGGYHRPAGYENT